MRCVSRLVAPLLACAVAACATGGAPHHASAPGAGTRAVRVRVWIAEAPRTGWRTGRLLALTSDSLVIERTDVVGRPRFALSLDSVGRVEVRRGDRDRAVTTGCLAGGAAIGMFGVTVAALYSSDVSVRFLVSGAAFGCTVGLLVGALVGEAREWQTLPLHRGAAPAPGGPSAVRPPRPRTPPPRA